MPKKNINQLDSLIEVFKDCKFDDFSILGLSFLVSTRLALIVPGDQKDHSAEDVQEFSKNRFNHYIDIDLLSELNSRFSEELLDKVFLDITSCFVSLAYHLNFDLSEDRLNINGEKTQTFNPAKVIELSKIEPKEIGQLFDIHELYSKFFFVLGRVLNQSDLNYEESFALSNLFATYASEKDQIGYSEIVLLSLKNTPPLYTVILNPFYHNGFFDENGLKEDRFMPFQIALNGFLQGTSEEICEFIWSQQRALFYNQETLEPINTDFQFMSIKNSEVLFDHYYEAVFLCNKDFFFSYKEQSISSNITFFAIFFYSFLLWSMENLKDSESI